MPSFRSDRLDILQNLIDPTPIKSHYSHSISSLRAVALIPISTQIICWTQIRSVQWRKAKDATVAMTDARMSVQLNQIRQNTGMNASFGWQQIDDYELVWNVYLTRLRPIEKGYGLHETSNCVNVILKLQRTKSSVNSNRWRYNDYEFDNTNISPKALHTTVALVLTPRRTRALMVMAFELS